ncbi:hypothetical protein BVY04_00975 [bacterium M21]|nr:hypothetical protein BVY04_00975 [bacterium M21]
MRVGLDCLNLERGKHVLMPASMCPAVLEPVVNYGLKISLYGLNRQLHWDIDDIDEKVTPATAAIYVIHYFGVARDLTALRSLCDDKGIALIEDCALCGFDPKSSLGKVGDISIFSLWKFYPISDGAILRCNNEKISEKISEQYYPRPDYLETLKRSTKILCNSMGMQGILPMESIKRSRGNDQCPFDEPEAMVPGDAYPVFRISSHAMKVFEQMDHQGIAQKRRDNFEKLVEFSLVSEISTLYQELLPESVPYCIPVIADDPIRLQFQLREQGIQTEIPVNRPFRDQPYLLPTADDFPDIHYLSSHVLALPMHQDIEEKQLRFIRKTISEIR